MHSSSLWIAHLVTIPWVIDGISNKHAWNASIIECWSSLFRLHPTLEDALQRMVFPSPMLIFSCHLSIDFDLNKSIQMHCCLHCFSPYNVPLILWDIGLRHHHSAMIGQCSEGHFAQAIMLWCISSCEFIVNAEFPIGTLTALL